MRVGSVEDRDGALRLFVAVILFDREGQRHWHRPLLDTGFNGGLTLPGQMIDQLGLEYLANTRMMLADGNEVVVPTYRASMFWRDEVQFANVFRMDGDPLLGTDLMRGARIEFDATHLGEILAKPIVQNINSA